MVRLQEVISCNPRERESKSPVTPVMNYYVPDVSFVSSPEQTFVVWKTGINHKPIDDEIEKAEGIRPRPRL